MFLGQAAARFRDVTQLIDLGLIERRDDQRVEVVWDVVAAEMKLAA